jgi:sugar phosphate isomerase/epimerase
MFMALSPGAMGIRVSNLQEAINVAREAGFGGVEFGIHEVANLIDEHGADHVKRMFADAGLKPAGWGLPVDWRGDEAKWKDGLKDLPRLAKAAQAVGCGRTMTWVMPCSNDRPLDENRRFHIERFRPIAEILGEYGCALGLEFIGPKTLRDSQKYPFIYKMGDMLAMGAEIGPNVGLLLDCFHWHTSGGTIPDLLALKPEQVVYVHVNDAPPGVALEEHLDHRRGLPGVTGVIDLVGFLQSLKHIGYDGPVTPEPFGNPATWVAQALQAVWSRAGI